MRRIGRALVWTIFFLSPSALAQHDLDEVTEMVRGGYVRADQLIFKFKESVKISSSNWRALADSLPLAIGGKQKVEPLFGKSPESLAALRSKVGKARRLPALENYGLASFERDVDADKAVKLLEALYADPRIEFAYFEPETESPVILEWLEPRLELEPTLADTPDFSERQFYLDAPPNGVNARYGWTMPGGDGTGVKVIDVEWGWQATHEDFKPRFWHNGRNNYDNHGTAVWGEVAAKDDGKGVVGIAHGVEFGTAGSNTPARTYLEAAEQLVAGDILIIEQHQRGPDNGKWTAMEYWQANFDAFQTISAMGILIAEAAGNGNSNFDGSVYRGKFDLNVRDSGAIIVGAGAPPGNSAHLTRLSFSNYGSRVDAFGYGRSVVTTGYGDLYGFRNTRDRDYTASFSGTSSATPIVAGSMAQIQGMAKAQGRTLDPMTVRAALRATGTPQQGNTNERIGNLPDVQALVEHLALGEP